MLSSVNIKKIDEDDLSKIAKKSKDSWLKKMLYGKRKWKV